MNDAGLGYWGIERGQKEERAWPYVERPAPRASLPRASSYYSISPLPLYTPGLQTHILANARTQTPQQDTMTDESDVRLFKGCRQY